MVAHLLFLPPTTKMPLSTTLFTFSSWFQHPQQPQWQADSETLSQDGDTVKPWIENWIESIL